MKTINIKNAFIGSAAAGIASLMISIFFDTAPEGTHNIGLMQSQILWSQFAAMCLIISSILFVGKYLGEKFNNDDQL